MALFSRFRTNLNLINLLKHRNLVTSSILSAGNNNNAPALTSKEKKRAAVSFLKSESNPERIVEICRAASLTAYSPLDRIAFSVAIPKLWQSSHSHVISQFLEELKTRPDLRQNQRFRAHTIVLYGQASMIDHAIRTFEEMEKYGLHPKVNSLNALLLACILTKNYKEVKRIFTEFIDTYKIEPNLETYNKVITSLCESGESSYVYSILAEMDRKKIIPNATSFGILLAGFYKEEKYEDVGKVLKMMETYGIESGVGVYNVRIKSLCKVKRSEEAKALLYGMVSRGMKPDAETYSNLIHGFCKEGNLEEAKKMFRGMIKRGLEAKSECYFGFMSSLCQGGDYETALKVCMMSMEKGWVPYFSIMKLLVSGLVSVSRVAEAKKLVGLMKDKFPMNVDMWSEIEAGLPQL